MKVCVIGLGYIGLPTASIMANNGLKSDEDSYLTYSPERVLPGVILKEMIANDLVVGGINAESTEKSVES